MKKSLFTSAGTIAFFLTTFSLSSCEKVGEFFPRSGRDNDYQPCNIRKIITRFQDRITGLPDSFVYIFSYDLKGNPVSIVPNKQMANSLYTIRFLYDHKNRLTDYYGVFNVPGISFDFFDLHTYQYDSKNRVVRENFYYSAGNFIDVKNGTKEAIAYYFYEYDRWGRIIKVRTINYPGTQSEYERTDFYQYDNHGNLIKSGAVYDTKLNMAGTNTIWMFLRRDYSKNNSFIAEKYNRHGFPILLNLQNSVYDNFLPLIYLGNSSIEYQCN